MFAGFCFSFLLVYCAAAAEPLKTVWSGPEVNLLGAPSPDGRYLSYVDAVTRNLSVRDLRTGVARAVTKTPAGSGQFAYFSVFSRDSARIAYAWFNEDGFYDLRIINLDGSGEKVLYRNEEAGFVQPCAWSPDGSQILALLFRSDNISHIALIPSAGGPPKLLRSLNWVYPKRMDLSPDGRFIAYDSFVKAGSQERTLYLLSTGGDKEVRLVDDPGSHLFPQWTPDGKSLVFATERDGVISARLLDVETRKATMLLGDLGRALPMGVTNAGEYYVGVRTGQIDVFVTTLDAPTAKPLRATIRYPGRNSAPVWSNDGKLLAFLSRSGTENFGESARTIVIRDTESDGERVLTPKLAHIERVRWAPDGRRLLASGSDGKGRGGIFLVDASSSAVQPLVASGGAPYRGYPAVWSQDGSSVYYLYGETELREHRIHGGASTALLQAHGLQHLAISPDGKQIAVWSKDGVLRIVPAAGGETRSLRVDGLTELEWGADLMGARGADLLRVPLDGQAPVKVPMPGNRSPGFSLHPDGNRLALTAGAQRSEVRVTRLPERQQ